MGIGQAPRLAGTLSLGRPTTPCTSGQVLISRTARWARRGADGHGGHVPDVLTAGRTPVSFDRRTTERINMTWVAETAAVVAGFVVVVDAEVEQLYEREVGDG
jgi:hypothetical protein